MSMGFRLCIATCLLGAGVSMAACGSSDAAASSNPSGARAAAPVAANGAPRLFITEPAASATIASPVRVRFGSEHVRLAAAPEALPPPEARPNTGHYHFGVDHSCPSPGDELNLPWRHVSSDSNELQLFLPPGPHRIVLQIGDDNHQAIAGLCRSVDVVVQ